MLDPPKTMTKKAGKIGFATLVSRILGFFRDAFIAKLFGAGLYSDAFFAAFRIPDFLRKLFSDGTLSISFIPVFTQILIKKGKEDAFDMIRSSFMLVFLLGTIAMVAGFFSAPVIFKAIAPNFSEDFHRFSVTVMMAKTMMPYIVFISLMAVCMGALNAMGHFFAPSVSPIILNLTILFFAGFVSSRLPIPALALALGVTTGGFLQLILHWPFLISRGFKLFKKSTLFHPGTLLAAKRLFPAMAGLSAYQVNMLTGTFLASTLGQGSISHLYYADRLVQFPLGLFTVSVTTVLLPELSKKVAKGIPDDISDLFERGIEFVFFITLPSLAGLIALREPIVTLLFFRGAFDANAVQGTCSVLIFFSFGLWALSGNRLFVILFHGFSNTKIPFKAGVISMAANIIFSLYFMKIMGLKGIALGVCAASMVNFAILFIGTGPYLSAASCKKIMKSACRSVFFSGIMFVSVKSAASFLCPSMIDGVNGNNCEIWGNLSLFAGVSICIFLGILIYAGLGIIFKTPEMAFMIKLVKKNEINQI